MRSTAIRLFIRTDEDFVSFLHSAHRPSELEGLHQLELPTSHTYIGEQSSRTMDTSNHELNDDDDDFDDDELNYDEENVASEDFPSPSEPPSEETPLMQAPAAAGQVSFIVPP